MAIQVRPEVAEARVARQELGLGLMSPLDDVLRVVEGDAGVPVTVMEFPQELAGLYRQRLGHNFIFINGCQAVVRQRFTLAHEFGHYRLGHSTVVDLVSDVFGKSRDPQEIQANFFAGEFLAPLPALSVWMEATGSPKVDLETVVRFASRFGISAMASRVRFETAGLIGKTKAREVDKQIEAREHLALRRDLGLSETRDTLASLEPADLPRIPQEMTARAGRILASGVLDAEQIAAQIGRSPEAVERELVAVGGEEDEP